MEYDEEYFPALEACYTLLTENTYLHAMRTLFNKSDNKWFNVKDDWLDTLGAEFYGQFNNELITFDASIDDLADLFVMWSIPPNDSHGGMYLVLFFNSKNFIVSSTLYNYKYLLQMT